MAILHYKSGAQTIRKYEDVATDFPVNGIHVADTISIGIRNPSASGGPLDITITYDSPEEIEAGTATWLTYQTIAAGNDDHIPMEYGPTGVKFETVGTGVIAWVKS